MLASLGCGNPTAVAELRGGETVLDLGSGGGIDVLLSATRVGPTGHVFGLDMTDEMLDVARGNARAVGATNVEFLKGYIEDIPLPDASIDVVISNCVINLSTDKPKVIAEMFRVLRSGGRLGISDVVAADELAPADRAERGSYVGCIAGALSFAEYTAGLTTAGFVDISIRPTHEMVDQMFGAIVQARQALSGGSRTELPRVTLPSDGTAVRDRWGARRRRHGADARARARPGPRGRRGARPPRRRQRPAGGRARHAGVGRVARGRPDRGDPRGRRRRPAGRRRADPGGRVHDGGSWAPRAAS